MRFQKSMQTAAYPANGNCKRYFARMPRMYFQPLPLMHWMPSSDSASSADAGARLLMFI